MFFAGILIPCIGFSQDHILGNFPTIDSGFENQLIGTLAVSRQPVKSATTANSAQNAGVVGTIKITGGRSGPAYMSVINGAAYNGFYSPTAALAQKTSYVCTILF
jgi:hypothetical protein